MRDKVEYFSRKEAEEECAAILDEWPQARVIERDNGEDGMSWTIEAAPGLWTRENGTVA